MLGPGKATTVTAIKPYHGHTMRNVNIIEFGTGFSSGTMVGIHFDRSCEFLHCGLGVDTASTANMNGFGCRYLHCIDGIHTKANVINLDGAWFENCTGMDIYCRDTVVLNLSNFWSENNLRTTPSIVVEGTQLAYPGVASINIHDGGIFLNAAATHFMRVVRAQEISIERVLISDGNYAAIQVDDWLMGLYDRGIWANSADGESDKNARVPLRIIGAGSVVSSTQVDDLANRPYERPAIRPFIGGFADIASTQLISDSGFESALNATGNGASAPTVTWDADAHDGVKCVKAVFSAASAGTAGYLRVDKNFAAVAGNNYVIEYFPKCNKAFRAMSFRMFNVTSGAFENAPKTFVNLSTTYDRKTVLWKCPVTGNWRPTWYKSQATTNDVTLWIDDYAVYSGSIPGIYLPGRTTAISKGAVAAKSLVIQTDVEARRLDGGSGATALVVGDVAISAGWGTTGSVTAISGSDQAGQFTIVANGTGLAADATATFTFKDGAWATAPKGVIARNGGNGTRQPTWTTTTTTLTISFADVPIAGGTYIFAWWMG